MRHKVNTDKLSRFSSYRKATLKSMATSVLLHQKIMTTKAKAKIARRLVDEVITLGKRNTLAAKRMAFAILCDHNLVKLLFDQIAPKFANINGGYTRIIPYRNRRGDNAKLVILELTQSYKTERPKKEIKETKEKREQKPVSIKEKKEELEVLSKEEIAKAQEEAKLKKEKESRKEKLVKEEEEEKKEPAKTELPHARPEEEKSRKPAEQKKPKGFFGGFRGMFKRKRDAL